MTLSYDANGKGSTRRPADPKHLVLCDVAGCWFLGPRCIRCGEPKPSKDGDDATKRPDAP